MGAEVPSAESETTVEDEAYWGRLKRALLAIFVINVCLCTTRIFKEANTILIKR